MDSRKSSVSRFICQSNRFDEKKQLEKTIFTLKTLIGNIIVIIAIVVMIVIVIIMIMILPRPGRRIVGDHRLHRLLQPSEIVGKKMF